MPGFYVTNTGEDIELTNMLSTNAIERDAIFGEYVFKYKTLNRFQNDKAFYEDEHILLILEGVVLNKQELLQKFDQSDMVGLVLSMRDRCGEAFFSKFRGSFSGCLFEKADESLTVWTNHYGDCPVFYSHKDDFLFVGSQFNYVLDAVRSYGLSVSADVSAVYCMLAYGYMDGGQTYVEGIKRLEPGHYLKYQNHELRIIRYWKLKEGKYDLSDSADEEILKTWDEHFRRAIQRQFGKDEEYGYKHIAELSGGLDSRMTTWVAHEMGFANIVNINFCQSGYLDELVAREIAREIKGEIILEPLDDARFLLDIDNMVCQNYGLSVYSGLTGGYRLFNHLNWSEFGILHTGTVGDVVLGCILSSEDELHDLKPAGLDNPKQECLIEDRTVWNDFSDQEEYFIFTRGFHGAATSHIYRGHTTSVASPFLDVDVLEFAMSIPVSRRANHKLYKKWVKEYYPRASDFIWEREGVPISATKASQYFSRFKKKIHRMFISRGRADTGMNPADQWLREYPEIAEGLDSYFNANVEGLPIDDELKQIAKKAYESGNAFQKTQVLTAVSALKQFCG